jgi:predicted DNA-binding transcriptional regulator YafY
VNDLRELTRWVLSLGPICTVLNPPELRAALASDLKQMLARYKSVRERSSGQKR